MVVIRLSRGGAKKRPFYQIVAADSRSPSVTVAFIQRVGFFNPLATGKAERLRIDLDLVDVWISKGATYLIVCSFISKEARKANA